MITKEQNEHLYIKKLGKEILNLGTNLPVLKLPTNSTSDYYVVVLVQCHNEIITNEIICLVLYKSKMQKRFIEFVIIPS